MKKEVENIINNYLFELNHIDNRNKIAKDISKLYGFEFKDATTMEQLRYGGMIFIGVNPESKKAITISIVNENKTVITN